MPKNGQITRLIKFVEKHQPISDGPPIEKLIIKVLGLTHMK